MRRFVFAISVAAISLATFPGHAAGPVAYSIARPDLPFHPGRVITTASARQSTNWAGYNLGFLPDGHKLFTQVSGTWTVPTPSLHAAENEYSVNWVGIGGGCVDASCLSTDPTLIQAGSAQYIDSSGTRTYFAWWEIIPGPILQIANFAVRPGDRMYADLHLVVSLSNVWAITVKNLTTGQTYTTTVPYSSAYLTAEWIEERPSVGGLPAPLPSLTNPRFNDARVNGAAAHLSPAQSMDMADTSRLATPSNPDPDANGFNVCTYTTSCGAPSGA